MTCEDVSKDEIVERYMLDQLSADARESFEAHYFECARCFGLLRTYRDVQSELERSRQEIVAVSPKWGRLREWAWVPALAAVLIAVSVTVWQRPPANVPAPTGPSGPAVEGRPGATPKPPAAVAPPQPLFADLARVDAPRYTQPRVRGVTDDATVAFQQAMEHYLRRDYERAITGLREASALDREAPHILFFLSASQLLVAQTDAAIESFGKTIALGDSPYLEEAHFYLAKAYLRKEDLRAAASELERTIELGGERQPTARTLLEQVKLLEASR